ncbi:hypothetical protein [Azospirillum sp.]|uniref:hypothetical protein n=1 Tax=Azospirillum sp. TaxID=34012 RepID=UPI002610B677|nr:hypothetical protein [Azospirillum sp.]
MEARRPKTDYLSKFGNDVLYRMCQERPKHELKGDVFSKIWLIGSSYSASLKRGANQDNPLEKVTDAMTSINNQNQNRVDCLIQSVSRINCLTTENIHISLAAHSKFLSILSEVIDLNRRSFASKYLHFHAPQAFFIFDSVVNKNIRSQLKEWGVHQNSFRISDNIKEFDETYSSYCLRAIYYRDEIMRKPDATPREVDRALYGY